MCSENVLAELAPELAGWEFVERRSVGGGCISQAERVTIECSDAEPNRRTIFWKSNSADFLDNFRCEADGLRSLAKTDSLRTPRVLGVGEASGRSHLLLEAIERARGGVEYRRFGDALAEHHRSTEGSEIGWITDNYLGASPQRNQWDKGSGTWPDFVVQRRIEPQVRMAADRDLLDPRLKSYLKDIIRNMESLLSGRENRTSLLHGDLWSGNFWSDPSGAPVWIDPAVYRGCREAEFGMVELFGGCSRPFYEAYQSRWSMPDGWKRRVEVYVLYHLLNHLNLFGVSYQQSCRDRATSILRAS
ncbi:fructosamine kinase family protein [Rhodopirellula sallentina]|uniref:Fructosamine/Ketosamine-3-kinase n=1 Tax=Rhodopirellula sallentina SM41 TaxID=1263870 RepID=M5ULR9_9BACT|nr:fructosamine kinase family protein [Rhodopirellula sallentina]EMI56968.1 Fructosamine/Ketosamine-3-kinase [Rhodopirellula sallentina SM41]